MDKAKHMTEEEWIAIARDLYDESDGTTSPSGSGQVGTPAEIAETAREIDLYFRLKKFDEEQAFQRLKYFRDRFSAKQIVFWHNRSLLVRIAAVVIVGLIVASAGFFAGSSKQEDHLQSGVVVDEYGNSKIQLPDGSAVTLNRDTKINYPDKFGSGTREVHIEGEAFFEVQADAARPFIIYAGKATIKVLGTSFNVNAYPGNEEVEVVVETGKVQVSKGEVAATAAGEMILDPGERGILKPFSGEMRKSRNDNPNFLSWKTRNFIFTKTSLKEVMEQLNKVYHVQVKASEPHMEKLLLTARFEGRSLDFILKVIAMTHDLKIEQADDSYILQKSS